MREPLCLCDRWLRRVWKGSWWAPISAAVDLSMALSASWTNSHVALLSTWLKAWMVIDFRLCQTLCQLLWTMNAVHFLELKIFLVSFIDEGRFWSFISQFKRGFVQPRMLWDRACWAFLRSATTLWSVWRWRSFQADVPSSHGSSPLPWSLMTPP